MSAEAAAPTSFQIGLALSAAFRMVLRNIWPLLGLSLTWSLPVVVLLVAVDGLLGGAQARSAPFGPDLSVFFAAPISFVVILFYTTFLQGAVAAAGLADVRGEGLSFSEGWRVALGKMAPLAAIFVIQGLAILVGCLVIVGGIDFQLLWYVSGVAEPAEKDTGVFTSFSRSVALTEGTWVNLFGLGLLIGLIDLGFFLVAITLFAVVNASVGAVAALGLPGDLAGKVVIGGLMLVVFPVLIMINQAAPVAAYLQLKAIKEGVVDVAETFG